MPDDADYASEAQALHLKAALSQRLFLPRASVICDECTMPVAHGDMIVLGGRKICRECAD